MPSISYTPNEYWPTSPRTGNEGGKVFRMQNLIIRGEGVETYAEVYGGSLNLSEDIATSNLAGTVTVSTTSLTVTGAGTAFTTELHLGQFVLVGAAPNHSLLVVDEIADDTHFTCCRFPNASGSGLTATILPVIFEMNKKRGTLIRGNAIEFDKGTLLCVGDGVLRVNGSPLSASLTATRSPQIAILSGSTYTIFTLGMNTPASLSAADVGGGTKNMQVGTYSGRVCPARLATNGYNNPSPKAEVTLAVAGDQIQFTVPAADTTHGQDGWMFFVSLFLKTGSGINGPWFRWQQGTSVVAVTVGNGAGQIPAAGGTYTLEYNDAEVAGNDLLTFNNDAPPKAEFVATVGGSGGAPIVPVWVSCMGRGSTSPGPYIAPSKPQNIEAAPAGLYVSPSPPDTILGCVSAQGRLYLLCVNTLQVAQATQSQDPRIPPVVIRPFWKSGFKHPYQLVFVDGFLVGATSHGLARSISEGDESGVEFNWANPVNEFVLAQNPAHQLMTVDPSTGALCLFYSGQSLNSDGFWTTRVLMYGLREQRWIGDVLLTSSTGDMLVSGVAVVNGQLEFLAGGRQSGGSTTVRTYRWNQPSANATVPWYIAWQYADLRVEDRPKRIRSFRVTGKLSGSPTAGIHTVQPGATVDVTALEAGNSGSASGSITLATSSVVTEYNRIELNVNNAMQFTCRVDGTWTGSANAVRDRIDEVVLESFVDGAQR